MDDSEIIEGTEEVDDSAFTRAMSRQKGKHVRRRRLIYRGIYKILVTLNFSRFGRRWRCWSARDDEIHEQKRIRAAGKSPEVH